VAKVAGYTQKALLVIEANVDLPDRLFQNNLITQDVHDQTGIWFFFFADAKVAAGHSSDGA